MWHRAGRPVLADGGRFIEMSAARSLPANELPLLRAAYETVMGG